LLHTLTLFALLFLYFADTKKYRLIYNLFTLTWPPPFSSHFQSLNHPHVVRLLGVYDTPEYCYLALE
jgi:hypothetical protein